MPLTLKQHLQQDKQALMQQLGLSNDSARIEIQMLLQKVLNVERVYLLSHPETTLNESQKNLYQSLLSRRLLGEPLAYILGQRDFFGLSFKISPATLIPRPDTEILVEQALLHAGTTATHILDLGTGSGAIALSLAHNLPHSHVFGIDASLEALAIAEQNRQTLQLTNATLIQSNWFSALTGKRFHLIVSNPPYIEQQDPHLTQGDLRFEPLSALASGTDGLDDIRWIIEHSVDYLAPQGWLLFEHGYNQAALVRDLLAQRGFEEIYSTQDLAGIERVTGGCLTNEGIRAIA